MFIILHRAEHRPIYINPKYISKMEATGPFQQAQDPNWTTALTVDGQTVYVTETIDEILIKEDAALLAEIDWAAAQEETQPEEEAK